jgi:hypothetical protein
MNSEQVWDVPRRGHRFGLQLPVRFRTAGEAEWHVGTTENVSRSGVLIRAGAAPAPDAAVDVLITLPPSGGEPSGCLRGNGRVVRNVGPSPPSCEPAFVVTFTRYRLEPLTRALDTAAR